ncbi:MAG: hypothetical protein IH910_07685 [Proteobacteria bacterium]|nr:hypothetical protein [Pseudomonadota bacterium]
MNSINKREFLRNLLNEQDNEYNDLRSDIQDMSAQLDRVQGDIAATKHLLKSLDGPTHTNQEPKDKLKGLGFRKAARAVLSEHPNGLANAEIRKQMTANGYVYEFDTPFGTRMGNELIRMREQNQIRKDGKRYILTEKGRTM